MSLPLDISGDFAAVVDGQATVTLRRTSGVEIEAPNAVIASLTCDEVWRPGSNIIAGAATWEFALPEEESPPEVGDQILHAETCWRVIAVEQSRKRSYFRCRTTQTSVASSLLDRVDIEEIVSDGVAVTTWRTIRSAVPASIRVVDTVADHQATPPTSQSTYQAVLWEDLPLDHRHRLRSVDGAVYRVERYRAANVQMSLPVVDITLTA